MRELVDTLGVPIPPNRIMFAMRGNEGGIPQLIVFLSDQDKRVIKYPATDSEELSAWWENLLRMLDNWGEEQGRRGESFQRIETKMIVLMTAFLRELSFSGTNYCLTFSNGCKATIEFDSTEDCEKYHVSLMESLELLDRYRSPFTGGPKMLN
jgi:hypothetical protein